jgi:hypothetical protein
VEVSYEWLQTRRGLLLAGIVAPVAATLPATLAHAADADGELLALGREYEAAILERDRLLPSFEEMDSACNAEIDAWRRAHPEPWRPAELEAWSKELWSVTFATWHSSRDAHPYWAAEQQVDALASEIEKRTARTIYGLAVKARVFTEYVLKYEDWTAPPDELDYDKFLIRSLVENLCALAAMGLIAVPQAAPGSALSRPSAGGQTDG